MIVVGGPMDGQNVVRPGSNFYVNVPLAPQAVPRRLSPVARDRQKAFAAAQKRDYRVYRYQRRNWRFPRSDGDGIILTCWMPQDGPEYHAAKRKIYTIWELMEMMASCW